MASIGTGVSCTRSSADSADSTWVWTATKNNDGDLVVTCHFGGSNATNNTAVATLTWGHTHTTTMENQQNNPAVGVTGKVQVTWSSGLTSYIVTFFGTMNRPNVNDIISADLALGTATPGIIVYCNMS